MIPKIIRVTNAIKSKGISLLMEKTKRVKINIRVQVPTILRELRKRTIIAQLRINKDKKNKAIAIKNQKQKVLKAKRDITRFMNLGII